MTRKQSLRKLERTVLDKVGALAVGPNGEHNPYASDPSGEFALASKRISEGGYGQCLDCGQNIPLARLQAKPEAVRCVQCQSTHEHRAPTAFRLNTHLRSAS